MILAELLKKNVVETQFGGIINKFKIGKRRDVLFFEEILANYIKICEDAGYKEGMKEVAKNWAFLYIKGLLPEFMQKMPKTILLNTVLRNVWVYFGMLGDFKANLNRDKITFLTREEVITRYIGRNEFCTGLWEGVLSGLYKRCVDSLSTEQSRNRSEYRFCLKGEPFDIESKDKGIYIELNRITGGEDILKKYLRAKIIVLKNNRLTYRGKSVVMGENTLFHLFGAKNILMGRIAGLSRSCFREIIDPASSEEKKMVMLKNMLCVFGWGRINILHSSNSLSVEIRNPPYGIQKEEDNWNFLAYTILGYFSLLRRGYSISEMKKFREGLKIVYSACT